MAVYRYNALDKVGKKKNGVIEALSEKEAREKLRDMGVMVVNLTTQEGLKSRQNLNAEQLFTFTLQLSQLVSAGVPLYESLVAIEEQYRNESFHRVMLSLCEQVKAGMSLSGAMAAFPNTFDKLYRAMIMAGEQAGALDIVLERLSQFLGKRNKLKKQIGTAMIYPAILASFSLLVIATLLGFVIPSIEGIFSGRQLNSFTQFVLSTSRIFREYWWVYIPAIVGFGLFAFFKLRSRAGKLWMERTFIRFPLVGTLLLQAAIARFCRTMGTLLHGGLTMIDSLRIAREVMGNITLEEEMKKAEARIIEGSSLSVELTRSKWIPSMVSRMLAVGEDSGSTLIMFNKIADMYEDELEKTLDRLLALAQPVILIFMGTVIGVVLMAILLPLTDISSLGT